MRGNTAIPPPSQFSPITRRPNASGRVERGQRLIEQPSGYGRMRRAGRAPALAATLRAERARSATGPPIDHNLAPTCVAIECRKNCAFLDHESWPFTPREADPPPGFRSLRVADYKPSPYEPTSPPFEGKPEGFGAQTSFPRPFVPQCCRLAEATAKFKLRKIRRPPFAPGVLHFDKKNPPP